ncbi:unnamed protein product, partial [Prorocentrum cordatum]
IEALGAPRIATLLVAPQAAPIVALRFGAFLAPCEAAGQSQQGRFHAGGASSDYGFNQRHSARGEFNQTSFSHESLLRASFEVPGLGPLEARARSGDPLDPPFWPTAVQLGLCRFLTLELSGVPNTCGPCQLRLGGPAHDRRLRHRAVAEIRARGSWTSDYAMKVHDAHSWVQQGQAPRSADISRRAEAAPSKLHAELERLAPPRTSFRGVAARARAKPLLELICGSANLAKAVYAAGWAAESWDYADGSGAGLLDDGLIELLVGRISRNDVVGLRVGLGCKTWSRARKNNGLGPPPLRDDVRAHGLEHLAAADAEKVSVANCLLANVLRLLVAAIEAEAPFSLENPRSSRLWLAPELLNLAHTAKAEWVQ